MQGKKEKPKVRFTRRSDGSIGLPGSASLKTDEIADLWSQQKSAYSTKQLSFKKEVAKAKKNVINSVKKPKVAPVNAQQKATASQKITNTTKVSPSRSLNVSLPSPNMSRPMRLLRSKKTIVVLSVAVVGILIYSLWPSGASDSYVATTSGEVKGAIETKVTPSFATLTPNGEGVDSIGGFAKISPEGSPPVYAFTDTINDIPIKVSQQELPDSFLSAPADKIKELATQFNANEKLEVGDFTAYIGASVDGVQSVVYVKGTNLVFIASDATIPNEDWVKYIGNLRY